MKKLILLSLLSLVSGAGIVAAQNGQGATAGSPSMEDGKKHGCHGDRGERHARFLKAADKDGDGTVSEAEKQAFFESKSKERFAKHDENGDGFLTKEEVGRMPEEFFAKLDANNDGKLSQDEMKAMKRFHGKRHGHHGKRGQRGDKADTAI